MDQMELPLGFGMALSQNEQAMHQFELLSESEKASVIDRVKGVQSKREMQQFVSDLGSGL